MIAAAIFCSALGLDFAMAPYEPSINPAVIIKGDGQEAGDVMFSIDRTPILKRTETTTKPTVLTVAEDRNSQAPAAPVAHSVFFSSDKKEIDAAGALSLRAIVEALSLKGPCAKSEIRSQVDPIRIVVFADEVQNPVTAEDLSRQAIQSLIMGISEGA